MRSAISRVRIDRVRMVLKKRKHLRPCFQITLAVFRQQFAGVVYRAVIFYAGENIEELAVGFIGVIRTVRGKIRNAELVRKCEQRLIYVFFAAKVMTLQFDIKPVLKYIFQPRRVFLSAVVFYAVVQKTVAAARKTKQAGRMPFNIFSRGKMLAFFVAELDGRDQL